MSMPNMDFRDYHKHMFPRLNLQAAGHLNHLILDGVPLTLPGATGVSCFFDFSLAKGEGSLLIRSHLWDPLILPSTDSSSVPDSIKPSPFLSTHPILRRPLGLLGIIRDAGAAAVVRPIYALPAAPVPTPSHPTPSSYGFKYHLPPATSPELLIRVTNVTPHQAISSNSLNVSSDSCDDMLSLLSDTIEPTSCLEETIPQIPTSILEPLS